MKFLKIKSLGLKISLIVTAIIVLLVVFLLINVRNTIDQIVNEMTSDMTITANNALKTALEEYADEAQQRAIMIAEYRGFPDIIRTGDIELLREHLSGYQSGVDMITIVDAQGVVLTRMHNDTVGDNLGHQQALSAALTTGNGIAIIEEGATVKLSTAGTAAIKDEDGNIIGAVKVGHDLSNPKYVDKIKESSNCETTIFYGDTRLSTTLVDDKGDRVVGTQASDTVVDTVLNQGNVYIDRLELFGTLCEVMYSPFVSNGVTIGMLFTGVDIEDIILLQNSKRIENITMAFAIGIPGLIIIFILCMFMISKPLKKLGLFASKIKDGELGISSSSSSVTGVRSSDEVGNLARELEQAYSQLRGYIGEINDRMSDLANGNLDTESTYDFHGDFVLIKDSINSIVSNLNKIMSGVSASADQVAAGANQVATGSQALAQGSTQQASTVEQLSNTITDVSEKTKQNAKMADDAATLSIQIKSNAEKGNSQMDQLMKAVAEINEASNSISKVMKVIDDIAFQTNILALNAAVEAARAGQHGKGFAVVAEEVRSLASKSAEAAKDTGGMIENSIEKATLGTNTAKETMESLKEIVEGINQSSEIITQIAQLSDEQANAIDLINSGIEQVSQVIQQNSATAEESAAASEEMNSQATMLQENIGQFKLKTDNAALLPGSAQLARKQLAPPRNDSSAHFGDNENLGKY